MPIFTISNLNSSFQDEPAVNPMLDDEIEGTFQNELFDADLPGDEEDPDALVDPNNSVRDKDKVTFFFLR